MNVQGAAPTPWPDPAIQAAAAAAATQPALDPTRAVQPRAAAHHDAVHKAEARAAANPYDAMRLQAYRRDAAATASLSTQSAPLTATASTASAPATKVAQSPQINPLPAAPPAPARPVAAPQAPPAIQAPAAIDQL